jgi:hypothetical protein
VNRCGTTPALPNLRRTTVIRTKLRNLTRKNLLVIRINLPVRKKKHR